jgi:LuxR family maltose regulon positive regulatory protein
VERADEAAWGYGWLAACVLLARVAGSTEDSLEVLTDALHFAQSEGFVRTFADAGGWLIPILTDAARAGIQPEYVGILLDALNQEQTTVPSEPNGLVEPLSDRELEVLHLLVAGFTNPEIADQLVISVGTVKTHVHNIYSKLGVRNRSEAINRTRELRLLQM